MNAALAAQSAASIPPAGEGERPPIVWWRAILASWEGRIGVGLALTVLVVIIFGRYLAPYSPLDNGAGPVDAAPSGSFPFGTDDLGRDVLSRVLTGGTFVLLIPLASNALASIIGGSMGIWGAYVGGRGDRVVTSLFDVMLTLPPLLMILVIIAGLGTSTGVLIGAITFFFIPRAGRVLRGAAHSVVAHDYIAAAQARGEGALRLVWREILPNIVSPAIADFALRTTYAIIFVATLSYLGLGVQPPTPDWGAMVAQNQGLLTVNPLAVLGPIIVIAVLAISLNLIADSVSRQISGGSDERQVAL